MTTFIEMPPINSIEDTVEEITLEIMHLCINIADFLGVWEDQ
jgi:hypothetical protein